MADEQEKQATAAKGEVKTADEKKPAAKSPAKKSDASAEKKTETKGGRAKKPATSKPATAKTAAKKPAKKTAPAELVMVRATARYVRSSPRKSRLVVDHIRGDKVEDARVKLQFIARHVARDVAKVLESAVSNAEHNHELDADDLTIAIAYVDEGPTLKRWRPRARGRASQILKRTSHITVVVSNGTAEQITEFSSRKAAA
jgi:ribosomal protein L22